MTLILNTEIKKHGEIRNTSHLGVAVFTHSSLALDIDIGIQLCSDERFHTYKMVSLYGTDSSQWVVWVSFTQMPESFRHLRSPWRVSKNVNKADTVNKLLEHSLVVQSSTVPDEVTSQDLRHFIMSNNCINISILLDYYLAHLGVASKVYCGALKAPGDDSNALMHVFLKVEEELVDNTYVHIEEQDSAQENINKFIEVFPKMKTVERYDLRPPSQTSLKLYHETASDMDEIRFTEITCSSSLNMKKATAMSMSTEKLGLGIKVYDELMRHYIKTEFGADIPCVTEVMARLCWGCGQERGELKQCAGGVCGMFAICILQYFQVARLPSTVDQTA